MTIGDLRRIESKDSSIDQNLDALKQNVQNFNKVLSEVVLKKYPEEKYSVDLLYEFLKKAPEGKKIYYRNTYGNYDGSSNPDKFLENIIKGNLFGVSDVYRYPALKKEVLTLFDKRFQKLFLREINAVAKQKATMLVKLKDLEKEYAKKEMAESRLDELASKLEEKN
jgi:hypothetical protein